MWGQQENVLGCGRRCGKRYERCRKVCWGVGEVRGDVGKGEGIEEVWISVLGPHILTHSHTLPPFLSPHPFPHANTLSHSPHTVFHTPPHSSPLDPHLSYLTSPHTPTHFPPYLLPQLPSPPATPLHTSQSPFTPCTHPHLSPHLPPQFQLCGEVTVPCDDVTLVNLTGKGR